MARFAVCCIVAVLVSVCGSDRMLAQSGPPATFMGYRVAGTNPSMQFPKIKATHPSKIIICKGRTVPYL
jgi:hypothetical protein